MTAGSRIDIMIHIIYMAAGNSRRFGRNKLLEDLGGKPLWRHGFDLAAEACRERQGKMTLTVVSREPEILSEAAKIADVETVYSPDSDKGVSYTIGAGIRSLKRVLAEDVLLFMVADQPMLGPTTFRHFLQEAERLGENGNLTASLCYRDRPGNPCAFSAELLPQLLSLEGDQGGRSIVKQLTCTWVEAESEAELQDIDTQDTLRRIRTGAANTRGRGIVD